jgi:hypothetical protein
MNVLQADEDYFTQLDYKIDHFCNAIKLLDVDELHTFMQQVADSANTNHNGIEMQL